MTLPLSAGHVMVRLHGGQEEVANTVLDALQVSFPSHTGRGRTRVGNVWEDPPTMLSVPQVWSQTFDPLSAQVEQDPVPLSAGITAEVLGAPDVVYAVIRVLGELFHAEEQGMIQRGLEVEVQVRLGPVTAV